MGKRVWINSDIGGRMIKQILILLVLVLVGCMANAGNYTSEGNSAVKGSPAVRNSIKYSYDLLAGQDDNDNSNFSDDFNLPVIRQVWNVDLDEKKWTLRERPGFLRIKARKTVGIDNFLPEYSFYQIVKTNSIGDAIVFLDLSNMTDGDNAGFYFASDKLNYIGIEIENGTRKLVYSVNNISGEGIEINETSITIRTKIGVTTGWFEYSFDGLNYTKLGSEFKISSLTGSDNRIGLYCISNIDECGFVDVDWFYYNPQKDSSLKFAENCKGRGTPEI